MKKTLTLTLALALTGCGSYDCSDAFRDISASQEFLDDITRSATGGMDLIACYSRGTCQDAQLSLSGVKVKELSRDSREVECRANIKTLDFVNRAGVHSSYENVVYDFVFEDLGETFNWSGSIR